MAKHSTTNTSSLSTSDAFIMDVIDNEPTALSTGEKVAIGFGIAGGAIVIGFLIFEGIKYLVTKKNNQYYTIPVNNIPQNTPQLNPNQYAQYIQPQQQPVQQQPITSQPTKEVAPQTQKVTAEQLVPIINTLTQQIGTLDSNQKQMVAVMGTMSEAIQNRNSAEFMELQNENAALKQQVNAANIDRERAESITSHLQGQYDNLASQVGAPLSSQFFQNVYGNPAGSAVKYPDVSVNDIVR